MTLDLRKKAEKRYVLHLQVNIGASVLLGGHGPHAEAGPLSQALSQSWTRGTGNITREEAEARGEEARGRPLASV